MRRRGFVVVCFLVSLPPPRRPGGLLSPLAMPSPVGPRRLLLRVLLDLLFSLLLVLLLLLLVGIAERPEAAAERPEAAAERPEAAAERPEGGGRAK